MTRGSVPSSNMRVAVATGLAAVIATAPFGISFVPGLAGLVSIVLGSRWQSRREVNLGGLGLFIAIVTAGIAGADALILLVAGVTSVVAWDVAERGVSIGRHVGRDGGGNGSTYVHAAVTGGVASSAALVAMTVSMGVPRRIPTLAVFALFASVALLVVALRG